MSSDVGVLNAVNNLAAVTMQQPAAIAAALAEVLKNQQPTQIIREIVEKPVEKVSTGHSVDTSGQLPEPITIYTKERIVEAGKTYTRSTHPLLFSVVDWLETNADKRGLGVRSIAAEFEASTKISVSKSWAAVAKNYWNAQR